MAVYYYKGAQIVTPFTITSNEPMFDVDTVSLTKQRASQGSQRWELEFNTVGTPDTVQDMLLASVTSVQDVDTMLMPQLSIVDELHTLTNTSTPVAEAGAIGDTTIVMQAAGTSGTVFKGTFFKFSNHDKIYLTTADCNFDSTNPTLSFYPALRKITSTSHRMKTGAEAILTYYKDIDNMAGITFSDGVLSNSGTIRLIEAL